MSALPDHLPEIAPPSGPPERKPVDVLAVIRRDAEHADAYRIVYGVIDATPQELARESEDVRAAVADLIEAAKKAQAMMAMPERIEPRHRQELCDAISRCIVVPDPRLARVQGGVE